MSDETIIRTLRERVDYLEEENRQLKERLTGEPWVPPRCLGLTPIESRIVDILMRVHQITARRLRVRIYGNEHRSLPLIYVHVTHVRNKLWAHRITVGKLYEAGLYLRPEDKARIRVMAAEEQG